MRVLLRGRLGVLMGCMLRHRTSLLQSLVPLRPLSIPIPPPPPHKPTLPTPHILAERCIHTQSPTSASQPSDQVKPDMCWGCHRDLALVEAEVGWEGGSAVVRFFCPCNRKVVLPPSARHSYFEIMNCPTLYRVDVERLRQTYKQLQRLLHPDMFSNRSPEEQDYSAQQSALVNTAYTTLLKPYPRGLYLLQLNGLTIDEKDTLLDSPEFLEGMWAVREGIEDASTSGDSAVLQLLQSTNTANLEKVIEEVEACFKSGDYLSAKEVLARMKYYVNIEELLKDTLELPS